MSSSLIVEGSDVFVADPAAKPLSTDTSNVELLSVVVPAYNEEATISIVLDKLMALPYLREIIVVDDCSKDATNEIAQRFADANRKIRVHKMPKNGGKTEALKAGFAMTTGEIVIVQDADLEYDPLEIPSLMDPIIDGQADVVYGSRFMVKRASRVLYFYHFVANKLLTAFSNALTNINLTDVETGYKLFRGEIIRNMTITSRGFGFEIEVTAKIAKLKCRIYEAPISYHGRTYEEGKKIHMSDGFEALWFIVKYNLFTSLKASFRKPVVLEPIDVALGSAQATSR